MNNRAQYWLMLVGHALGFSGSSQPFEYWRTAMILQAALRGSAWPMAKFLSALQAWTIG